MVSTAPTGRAAARGLAVIVFELVRDKGSSALDPILPVAGFA